MLQTIDPLPEVYLTAAKGIGGRLKARPDDFLVEETPLYQPVGEGEHLYLFIEKRGRPTLDVVRELGRAFHVRVSDIGYAGMKDKQAVTRQLLSIHTFDDSPLERLNIPGVTVLWADRHTNKLRLGHLAGNRFVIRVRDVAPTDALNVSRTLAAIAESGAPNLVGEQRFGFHQNNHEIGRRYVLQEWEEMARLLLGGAAGATGGDLAAREAFDRGDLRGAAAAWPKRDTTEYHLVQALARGRSARNAILSINEPTRRFFVSAFQSAVFNQALADRLTEGTFARFIEGDVAVKHRNNAMFAIGAAELADPETSDRLGRLEISPTGPMWGYQMMRAAGVVDEHERRVLGDMGVEIEDFGLEPINVRGARRALRTPVYNPEVEGGVDEHGAYVRIAFDLPRGSFATTVLREIMKTPRREHPWGADLGDEESGE